jgi:hypothetical protein
MRKTKNKVPMNKPYNIQYTNICNGIFHISFFKALLINEGETTQGANVIRGETTRYLDLSLSWYRMRTNYCPLMALFYYWTKE